MATFSSPNRTFNAQKIVMENSLGAKVAYFLF